MAAVTNGDDEIHYEPPGEVDGADRPVVVLVAGLGEQIGAVTYPDEQCDAFRSAGFDVVRMDNRETGRSRSLVDPTPPFTLIDMADDVAAVIRDLDRGPVNVLGASLGGFIVRWLAIGHPQLVQTLTVVMSGAGAGPGESGPQVDPAVRARSDARRIRRPRTEAIEAIVDDWRWLWGDGYPFPDAWVRRRVAHAYGRAFRPEGVTRQLEAVMATPGLWSAQRRITAPTLVLHGDRDPYFSSAHGRGIAESIPGAELWADPLMGHIMHREQWGELAHAVRRLADRSA